MWSCQYSRILREILKEITTEYSLEGLMLKLKLYTLHLMWRVNTLEKTLMLENIEDRRNRGQQRVRWLDDITDSMDVSLSNLMFEMVKDRETWHAAVHGVTKSQTWLSNWTELTLCFRVYLLIYTSLKFVTLGYIKKIKRKAFFQKFKSKLFI